MALLFFFDAMRLIHSDDGEQPADELHSSEL